MPRKRSGASDAERVEELFTLWREVMDFRQFCKDLGGDGIGSAVATIDRQLVRQLEQGMGVRTLTRIVRGHRDLSMAFWSFHIDRVLREQRQESLLWPEFIATHPESLRQIIGFGPTEATVRSAL